MKQITPAEQSEDAALTAAPSVHLHNADSIELMKTLPTNSVDLMLTDPPYNLGEFMKDRETNLGQMRDNFFVSAGWDNGPQTSWTDLMDQLFKEASRVLRPGGSALVFMSILKVESIVNVAQRYGFYYKTTGIWHKRNPMPRNMNLHFINSTESWIYFVYKKRTGTFNNNGLAVHDYVETAVTPKSERKWGKHPTQKPVALMQHFIDHLSIPNDVVIDPFMGSGSTGVAAVSRNRQFIGIELDKSYYELSRIRINEIHRA